MNLLSYHVQVFKLVWNLGDIKGLKKIVIEILLPVYLIFNTWPTPPLPEKKYLNIFWTTIFFQAGFELMSYRFVETSYPLYFTVRWQFWETIYKILLNLSDYFIKYYVNLLQCPIQP